ncbi:MAG: hypothetical protein ACLR7D_04290 [Lachnospira eligens]
MRSHLTRVDCYSVIGIAREAAATFRKPFVPPELFLRQVTTRDVNDNDFS